MLTYHYWESHLKLPSSTVARCQYWPGPLTILFSYSEKKQHFYQHFLKLLGSKRTTLKHKMVRSKIWFDLQANKLVCCSFLDAGRRDKTPESEKKGFVTHGAANSWSISTFTMVLLAPRSHKEMGRRPDGCYTCRVCASQLRNDEIGESTTFIQRSELAYSSCGCRRRYHLISQDYQLHKQSWKMAPVNSS